MAPDIFEFMETSSRILGTPGYEADIAAHFAGIFREYTDDVHIDALNSVTARIGTEGPKVMISAHQDEIGMVVLAIEDDGCIRLHRNGGVDPRILPSHEVSIITRTGPVYGVVGAKPPHLLSAAEMKNALKFEDIFVDIGYPAEKVKELVRVGDPVVMLSKPVKLANGRMAGKTLDDRASVASMVIAMDMLKRLEPKAQAYFVASSQEEVGFKGASTSAYAIDPDFAIAVDVTHAEGPGTGRWEAFPIDKMTIVSGPNLHPMLVKKAEEIADKWRIPYTREICSGVTGTDAAGIQIARGGIPTILLSVPLRYMHTSVETGVISVIEDVGKLIALFIDEISREWEGLVWY